MAQPDRQTEVMRQYLLGALSEAEQAALEARYLGDDDAFEEMVRVEHQLVDSYVQGRLPPSERTQFEQHYLAHPDRRERVQFASALQKKSRGRTRLKPRPILGGKSWWPCCAASRSFWPERSPPRCCWWLPEFTCATFELDKHQALRLPT